MASFVYGCALGVGGWEERHGPQGLRAARLRVHEHRANEAAPSADNFVRDNLSRLQAQPVVHLPQRCNIDEYGHRQRERKHPRGEEAEVEEHVREHPDIVRDRAEPARPWITPCRTDVTLNSTLLLHPSLCSSRARTRYACARFGCKCERKDHGSIILLLLL